MSISWFYCMMNRIRRIARLSSREKIWLWRSWWLLLGFWIAVRTMPFPRVAQWAQRGSDGARKHAGGQTQLIFENLSRCVDAARRVHWLPMQCLERSLTTQRLLTTEGISAELRIGVGREGSTISAHAWLELDGTPLEEPRTIGERYLPLVTQ